MNSEELWDKVRSCFEKDDGSLPSFELQGLTEFEIANIYKKIRQNSIIVTKDPCFWDIKSQSEKHLDETTNAAALVPAREAEPFHFAVEDLGTPNAPIPCIGVFIFQDTIAFDYRMGKEWGPQQVISLFSWLKTIIKSTSKAYLAPSVSEGPPDPNAFSEAWKKFYAEKNENEAES